MFEAKRYTDQGRVLSNSSCNKLASWSIGVLRWLSSGVMETMAEKYLFGIMVCSLLLAAPAVQGALMHFPDIPADQIQSVRAFEINRKSFVLAENKAKAAENRSPSTDDNNEQAAAPRKAVKESSASNPDDAAAKPLKPFKPSEEIAAEQAVDFPVDI